MLRPAVVVIALFLVGTAASGAFYVYEQEKEQGAQGKSEQPELRAASQLILSAYNLGLCWEDSDPLPMNLTGLSYIDLASAGFSRTYNGSEQSLTMMVMKYSSSAEANGDLRFREEPVRTLDNARNETMGYIHGTTYYFGPAPEEALGFYYIPPDRSWTEVYMQKGNVLVFVQGIGMDPETAIHIAEMQGDRVKFVPGELPPGSLS